MNKEEINAIECMNGTSKSIKYLDGEEKIIINQLQQENKQLKEQLGKLSKLDDTDFWLEYNRDVWKIQNENERLLELCMYALISNTSIYNHELANDTKQSFMKIIKDNIDLDTYSIREKIKKCWIDSNE